MRENDAMIKRHMGSGISNGEIRKQDSEELNYLLKAKKF